MKLSDHFELEELLRSETAARIGTPIVAPPEIVANLRLLCETLLEPIRVLCGNRIITPLSGYRPPWLNATVGGAIDSDHMLGGAADIQVQGLSPVQVCHFIANSNLSFRQCIQEFGSWCHISKPRPNEQPRRQLLTARRVGSRVVYEQGIHP